MGLQPQSALEEQDPIPSELNSMLPQVRCSVSEIPDDAHLILLMMLSCRASVIAWHV